MAHELTSAEHPRGCLMAMAAATSNSASTKLKDALAAKRMASRARLKQRIDRGIKEGDVPAGTDAAGLADFFSTIMSGMSMQAKDGVTRKSLLATVKSAMAIFPQVEAKKSAKAVAEAA